MAPLRSTSKLAARSASSSSAMGCSFRISRTTSRPTAVRPSPSASPPIGRGWRQMDGLRMHADLSIKERAIHRTAPLPAARRRYRPPDRLLAFLEGL